MCGEAAVSERAHSAGGEQAGPGTERAPSLLGTLLSAHILDVDGRPLSGRDLLAAGIVSGHWQRLERELEAGLGLHAADPVSKADTAEQLRVFRFGRGLLSAEDMRAWMEPRGLSIGDVTGVAARAVARARGGVAAVV